jgi:DNA-binding MarR family transcriptional regulator
MSTSENLNDLLRQWVDVFMTRSHHDLMHYLKAADLSMAQFGTLMRLHKDDRCGVSDIAAQMSVSNAAASQLVDKLVQHGLVERTEDPADRRMKRLSLTEKGRHLLLRGREARLAWTRGLGARLNPEHHAAVVAALEQLIEASRDMEEPHGA